MEVGGSSHDIQTSRPSEGANRSSTVQVIDTFNSEREPIVREGSQNVIYLIHHGHYHGKS